MESHSGGIARQHTNVDAVGGCRHCTSALVAGNDRQSASSLGVVSSLEDSDELLRIGLEAAAEAAGWMIEVPW